MWYHYTLTVPAGTAENSPESKDLKLTHGVIKRIEVGFPKGCRQYVKVRIYHEEHQIFPINPDEPASWDGEKEGGEYHYKLESPPYLLKAKGYAPEATYSHDISIFINLLPVEVAEPWREQISILERIKRVLGL